MKLSADKDRLLVAIGCALVIHVGVAVGLSFVDWSSTPERTPLYVELSDPALLDVPETEPPEPEPDPPLSEPEPEEVIEPPPAESEPEPSEDPPPTDQPEEPAPAEEPAPRDPAPAPERTPTRPQGPTEEDVADALSGMLGSGSERERTERAPGDPAPTTDAGEFVRAREEARREFEQALAREQEYLDSLEAAGESVDEAGDSEATVTPRIRDLIGRGTEIPDRPSEPVSDAPASDDAEGTDDSGDGFVEWEGDGDSDRELIEYWLPDFDGSDLRASGAREVRAQISFEVDAQGTVRPGSVNVLAPGLSPTGRRKVIEAVSSWRFDSRPGARVARGSIDFVFERTG